MSQSITNLSNFCHCLSHTLDVTILCAVIWFPYHEKNFSYNFVDVVRITTLDCITQSCCEVTYFKMEGNYFNKLLFK